MYQLRCELFHAKDGESALKTLAQVPNIEVVLMDIKLPGVNGIEITKAIRSIYPSIKVIAVTAYALNDAALKVNQSIFDAYITKPVNADLLLNYVRRFSKE